MGKPWQTVRHANGLGSVATAPLPVRSGEELPILYITLYIYNHIQPTPKSQSSPFKPRIVAA